MKPSWDKLAETHNSVGGVLIADVDCTAEDAKALCHEHGIRGYPTIKYFSEDTGPSGTDYSGGRSIDDLDAFVKEFLAKYCDPATLSFCDDKEKAYVEKQAGKDASKLTAELNRLRSLSAGGNVKDDGTSKVWLTKRIKILEALIGPSIMQRLQKMWGRIYFKTTGTLSRWVMGLAESQAMISLTQKLEPWIEAAVGKIGQWYDTVASQFSGKDKKEL